MASDVNSNPGGDESADDAENGARPGDERTRPTTRRKPTLGNPDADPQRIHREYVERHLGGGGGEDPSPEAYERAVEQWRRIPGSVNHPPAEMGAAESAESETDGDDEEGAGS